MPCLLLNINVKVAAEKFKDLCSKLSALVATHYGKPEAYCQVVINESVAMMFGGSDAVFLPFCSLFFVQFIRLKMEFVWSANRIYTA